MGGGGGGEAKENEREVKIIDMNNIANVPPGANSFHLE